MGKAVVTQLVVGILVGGGFGMLLGYLDRCSTGTCPLTTKRWRGGLYGMIAGAVLALTVPVSRPRTDALPHGDPTESVEAGPGAHLVHHVGSVAAFEEEVLQAELPVLVDFYSDSCPPCRMLGPTMDQLALSYAGRALVYKANVNQLPHLADRYGIRGIPAVLFFVGGAEKKHLVGLQPEMVYSSILDKLTN